LWLLLLFDAFLLLGGLLFALVEQLRPFLLLQLQLFFPLLLEVLRQFQECCFAVLLQFELEFEEDLLILYWELPNSFQSLQKLKVRNRIKLFFHFGFAALIYRLIFKAI
jgi:hypothetical protein